MWKSPSSGCPSSDTGFEFFPTERKVIEALLSSDLVDLPGGRWIEPCAGTGNIIKTVNDARDDVRWIVNEVDERFDDFLRPLIRKADKLLSYFDFVNRDWPFRKKADVLIMNPPFTLTMQFVLAAARRAAWVVCFQRQSWFGSQARAGWLREHCPDSYQIPWRPSFRPDGRTDNAEYSWYVWPPGSISGKRRIGRMAMLEDPAESVQIKLL